MIEQEFDTALALFDKWNDASENKIVKKNVKVKRSPRMAFSPFVKRDSMLPNYGTVEIQYGVSKENVKSSSSSKSSSNGGKPEYVHLYLDDEKEPIKMLVKD